MCSAELCRLYTHSLEITCSYLTFNANQRRGHNHHQGKTQVIIISSKRFIQSCNVDNFQTFRERKQKDKKKRENVEPLLMS